MFNASNRIKRTSIIFYNYSLAKNQFHLVANSKKTHGTHFCLLIYILLLLISGFVGMNRYTILQRVLCLSFLAGRLGLYSLFNIVTSTEVMKDAVDLLNKMLKFETVLLNVSNIGKLAITIFNLLFKLDLVFKTGKLWF